MGEGRGRFRELDGLRGIAALAVVFHHLIDGYDLKYPDEPAAAFSLHWGAYGVQLFFMISGFVILMSARRAQRPADFVVSRVSRLYPAYWIALTGTLVIAWGFNVYAAVARPSIVEALVNLTMVQRWLMVENVDQVYWTLAVEMQFYLIIFALLILTKCRLSDRVVAAVAGSWCAISFLVSVVVSPMTHGVSPQQTPLLAKLALNLIVTPYAALFVCGMLAFLAWQGERRWFIWSAAAGLLAAVQYGLVQSWTDALIVGVLVTGFLLVVARGDLPVLRLAVIQWLGKHSYSLYIGHLALGVGVVHWCRSLLGRPLATFVALIAVLAWTKVLHELGEERGSRALKKWLAQVLRPRQARPVAG